MTSGNAVLSVAGRGRAVLSVQVFEGTGIKPSPEMIWVDVQTNDGVFHLKIFYKDLLCLRAAAARNVKPEYERSNIAAFIGNDEGFLQMAWLKCLGGFKCPQLVAVTYVPGSKLK